MFQSTSRVVNLKVFLTSDHVTPATGKTVAVTIGKNGGGFGNPNAGATNATEISNGWYKVTLDTTDTNTVGDLIVRGTATGCDDSERVFDVVKATNGGMTAIPDTAVTTNASLVTSGTGTDQLSVSAGKVLLQATQTGVTIPIVTTVTNQLTAAQVATGVWTDTTAGDFTVSLSVGKSIMNGVSLGTGLTVAAVSGAVGSVTGAVGSVTGGVTVTTNNDKTGYSLTQAFPTNFSSLSIDASGRMDLGKILGTASQGAAGYVGIDWGKVTNPTTTLALTGTTVGTVTTLTNLPSIPANWLTSAGIASGAITRAAFSADSGHQAIRSGTAQAGGDTTITLDAGASATTDYYKDKLIYLTGGTGVGQSQICLGYNGSTKVATVTGWAVDPDNTTTFAVLPVGPADVVAWLGAAPTTLTTGKVQVDLQLIKGQAVTAAAGVTFPSSIASPTNITAGTITTTTNLTNLPSIPNNWLTAAGIAASALNGKGDWMLSSSQVSLNMSQALPSAPTANTVGEALFASDIQLGRINTCQAGSTSTTIKLDASASSTSGRYVGYEVYLYGGTGGGIRGVGQQRTIIAYDGTTKIATVDSAWGTTPDATTTYMLEPHPVAVLASSQSLDITWAGVQTYQQNVTYGRPVAYNDIVDYAGDVIYEGLLTLPAGCISDNNLVLPAESAGRPSAPLAMLRRVFETLPGGNEVTRDSSSGLVTLKNAAGGSALVTWLQSTTGTVDKETKGA